MTPLKVSNSITDNNSGTPPGRNLTIAGGVDYYIASSTTLSEADFYRFVVESVNEGIILINEKGEHIYRNPAVERIAGYSYEELKGKTVFDFIHEDEVDEARCTFSDVLAHPEKSVVKQYRIRAKSGKFIWVECAIRNMLHNEIAASVIVNYRDISVRKAAELEVKHLTETLEQRITQRTQDLEQANMELEAFSYSVSHDLRSPLRVISGYAKMVESNYTDCLDTEGRQLLKKIVAETRRMDELMDNLMKLSMVGKKNLDRDVVNMQDVTEAAYREVISSLPTNARIEIANLEPVNGDGKLLKHVMFNLLSNAVKYTGKKNDARVVVGSEKKGGHIVYYVKDNGDGFENDCVAQLFKPFSRLHNEDEFEGTGIGLSIVDRIVKRHGGEVWAHGSKGNGASFFFSLPVTD